jgi:hypothetical protein
MPKNRLHRAQVVVLALAPVAFLTSGIPDDKGTDAAIGWWTFVALALTFLSLSAVAVARAARSRRRPHAG